MMNTTLLRGELVQLTAEDVEERSNLHSVWGRDSEYKRLLDTDPVIMWSEKKIKEWLSKDSEKSEWNNAYFSIRTLEDNRLIGFIGLNDILWNHGDAWVGIGIGDRDIWGKGYGTDAMRILLRYAFMELNLYRLTLGVFSYNPRALRSYEKAGFVIEGCERQFLNRDGRRYDSYFMGILRSEWQTNLE